MMIVSMIGSDSAFGREAANKEMLAKVSVRSVVHNSN